MVLYSLVLKMNKGSSIFFGIWSLLFVVGALVQINDPDPLVWVSIYLIAAFLSGYVALGRFPKIPLAIVTILCFAGRSEEHTSELQSRPHLVCRLLLEKKK